MLDKSYSLQQFYNSFYTLCTVHAVCALHMYVTNSVHTHVLLQLKYVTNSVNTHMTYYNYSMLLTVRTPPICLITTAVCY